MSIDHAKELNRIANVQDYDDDEDAFEDAGLLLEIALHFERELKSTATALGLATDRINTLEAVVNYVYMVSDDIVTSEMVRRLAVIGFDPRDQYRKPTQPAGDSG